MKMLGIAGAIFLMSASGAVAADGEDSRSAKEEKKICKTERVTGSLTRVRRTCLTQREWDRLAEITRKGVDDLGRQAGTNSGRGES